MNASIVNRAFNIPMDFSQSRECSSTVRANRLPNFQQAFTRAQWLPTVFFNFTINPEIVRPFVPPELELDLFSGSAVVSIVAISMREFHACKPSIMGCFTNLIKEQRFLNLRTYVKWRDEPGALFLHGWLSRPWAIPLPSGLLGLPYDFAHSEYHHQMIEGSINGRVSQRNSNFEYQGKACSTRGFEPCPHGTLAEFAMERYAGFFSRRIKAHVFRVWHPPWRQISIQASIGDMKLIIEEFPWLKESSLADVRLTERSTDVLLGSVRSLEADKKVRIETRHHRAGALFEMP